MSLNLIQETNTFFGSMPSQVTSQPKQQELKNAYSQIQQTLRQSNLGSKVKIHKTFWNQNVTTSQVEISRIMHLFGFFMKPDLFKQIPKYSDEYEKYLSDKCNIRISLNLQKDALLSYFKDEVSRLWLRKKWLLRNSFKVQHIQGDAVDEFYQTVDYEKYQQCTSEGRLSNLNYRGYDIPAANDQIENIQKEITEIEQQLPQYTRLCELSANDRLYESQAQFEKNLPQVQVSGQENIIFDKVNQRIYEHLPFLKSQHLRKYYETKQSKMVWAQQLNILLIYLEGQLYQAQMESCFNPPEEEASYNYQVPTNLQEMQNLVHKKGLEMGVTQDISVDSGSVFLYAIDKKFQNEIVQQSNLYLQFLPYEVDGDQNLPNSHNASKSVGKTSETFQAYTIRMLKSMEDETVRAKQFRIRSAVHWLDNMHIFPEMSLNEQSARLILDQYNDPGVNAAINFLLYTESDRINTKIAKDVQQMTRGKGLPEQYFQFYSRMLKIFYLDSRQSIIQILNALNVFRTTQKNLNIYFLDLNGLPHSLSEERIGVRRQTPLENQYEAYSVGFFNENIYLSNPSLAQHGRATATTEMKEVQEETLQKIKSTAYWCEETIEFDQEYGIYRVLDGQGYKVLNETVFQDLFAMLQHIQKIAAYVLLYSSKHGLDEQQKDLKTYLQSLNREKVIQEILSFESSVANSKCRILQVVIPYLSKCNSKVLSTAIKQFTQLMSQRPHFEMKQTIMERYQDQVEMMNLVAQICERIAFSYPITKINQTQQNNLYFLPSDPVLKIFLKIIGVAFPDGETEFTFKERTLALQRFNKHYVPKLNVIETSHQLVPLLPEYYHLINHPILDTKDNFNIMVNELFSKAEKSGLELSCNAFTILEFLRIRRRVFKNLLRLQCWFDLFMKQARRLGVVKTIHEQVMREKRILNVKPANSQTSSLVNSMNRGVNSNSQHFSQRSSDSDHVSQQQELIDDMELFQIFLEEGGIKLTTELNKLENWHIYASDQLKYVELALPVAALTYLNTFVFNSVHLNTIQFQNISKQIKKPTQNIGSVILMNMHGFFIDIFKEKNIIVQTAQSNYRKKSSFKAVETEDARQLQPLIGLSQQIRTLLGQGNQFKNALSKSYLEQNVRKMNGMISTFLYELTATLKRQSFLVNLANMAINYRDYLEQYNQNLPFQTPLLKVPVFPIGYKSEQLSQEFKVLNDKNDYDASDGMFDQKGTLVNSFVVPQILYIMKILKSAMVEPQERLSKRTISSAEESLYLPGGQEWLKAQRLKLEKNATLLTPNKKMTKFRSAACPYTAQNNFDTSNLLEIMVSNMHCVIQLLSLLGSQFSPLCNREDLIFWQAGFLANKQEEEQRIGYYKRNQLRLQRDLEPLRIHLEKYQSHINKIATNPHTQNPSEAVLAYLRKLCNRLYTTLLTIQISAIHQFRHHNDNYHKTSYDEQFHGIIRSIRKFLMQVQFGSMKRLVKVQNQQVPVMLPQYTAKEDENNSLMLQFIRDAFVNSSGPEFNGLSSTRLYTQRIPFNPIIYFKEIALFLPKAFTQLYISFPPQKLIYISIIQDTIMVEAKEVLRTSASSEEQDYFAYERAFTKLIKVHLRVMIMQELVLVCKFNILPFEVINSLHLSDPVAELLQQTASILKLQPRGKGVFSLAIETNYMPQVENAKSGHIALQEKLRLDTFESLVLKLCVMMTACHNLMMQEGIDHYAQLGDKLASYANALKVKQILPINARFDMGTQLESFLNMIERQSLVIQTLNKGEAYVIGKGDLDDIFTHLNSSINEVLKINFENKIDELQISNEELKKMYNIRSLENEFQSKKIKFLQNNMNHIVESLVAQRTNELLYENESLKLQLHKMQREEDIKIIKLKEQINDQFKDKMQNQESRLHQIQNRFHQYKTGINLELTTLIREIKKDGLQKIKDQVYNALRDPQLQGYVNTDFVQEEDSSQKQIFATEPSNKELSEDAWDNFLLKNKEIIKLFSALKKQRILYKMKEMQIIDKYENELKQVLETNSSNDELQKRIHELSDKVESLKDEVIQNKRVMTVMDNQNQILKRDLQKMKNDRIKNMKEREKGLLNVENYYQKLDVTGKSNSPPKTGTLPDMNRSAVMVHDLTKTAPPLQSQTQLKTQVVTESLANLNRSSSSMRPVTATTAAPRPITAKTFFERNYNRNELSSSKSLKRFSSASKSTVIQVKYKIRKQQQL